MDSDGIELIHADCRDILRSYDPGLIDALITDPPYGVGLGVNKDMRADGHGLAKKAYVGFEDTYENYVENVCPAIDLCLTKVKRGAVFTGPHLQELPKASAIGGVYCPAGTGRHSWGFKTFLPIMFYGKDHRLNLGAQPNSIQSNATAEKNGHPCPKPLEWMIWLVERVTKPGEIVVDPFMGSGTTGVACLKTGRRFIGIERDPGYFRIAQRRINEARMPLFWGSECPPTIIAARNAGPEVSPSGCSGGTTEDGRGDICSSGVSTTFGLPECTEGFTRDSREARP